MSNNKKTKPPQHWGTSAAAFYADYEGKPVTIHLQTGETLSGALLGVDRYDIVLERGSTQLTTSDTRVLIPKHAIVYVEPGKQENP
jgi:sRNA-binding regulator protein Hfq